MAPPVECEIKAMWLQQKPKTIKSTNFVKNQSPPATAAVRRNSFKLSNLCVWLGNCFLLSHATTSIGADFYVTNQTAIGLNLWPAYDDIFPVTIEVVVVPATKSSSTPPRKNVNSPTAPPLRRHLPHIALLDCVNFCRNNVIMA